MYTIFASVSIFLCNAGRRGGADFSQGIVYTGSYLVGVLVAVHVGLGCGRACLYSLGFDFRDPNYHSLRSGVAVGALAGEFTARNYSNLEEKTIRCLPGERL